MHATKSPITTKTLVYAAACLALALFLPFLTGQIPQIGSAISPMHIPVFLAGFLCGGPVAALVGFVAPLLRSALFTMPPFYVAIAMAFELATYGLVSGLLYRKLPKTNVSIYTSLIGAMLAGRIVWGIVKVLLSGVNGQPFTFAMFWAGGFANAVPALICHIALVPLLVMALRRAGQLQE